ncbi:CoA transferase [Mesorhizobium sp. B2-1-3A]|uniref:CaiB/BaiF CoA transferase family protein n=1 Tax=Mesorhizobium sp. B2-1-3A TaxID=2589971 RepID=UPI0015E319AA|nr:CoA transferase [Mesorhizobium sp. B2-1-3A]
MSWNPSPTVPSGSALATFLAGVRVLDLSQYIPGPLATLLLADMGAEVLKVEPPRGDEMRTLGPRDALGRPIFYNSLNAGKTVKRLDLKDDADRSVFLDLARSADVVVEGFRPGVLERLGVGYEVLKSVNPRIVLCSINGYGARSAYAAKAGHDANYLALKGMLDRNGTDKPIFFDPPVSDVAGSLFAAIAILGALHGRVRTGKGCAIDLALADTAMPLQLIQIAAYGANGTIPARGETYLNGGAAYYQVYATRDGRYVVLGAIEPKFWEAFCNTAGRSDWIERQLEALPQHALRDAVASFFSSLSKDEIEARFQDVDCCLSIVNDLGEALADVHTAERGLVRRNAEGDLQALFPALIDGTPPSPRSPLSQTDHPRPAAAGASTAHDRT